MYDIKNLNIWKPDPIDPKPSKLFLDTDISDLELSVRSFNCLKRAGCSTIGDVIALMDTDGDGLRNVRNLGKKSEEEILGKIEARQAACKDMPSPQESTPSGSGHTIMHRRLIQPAIDAWEMDIESFHLSNYALDRLRQHGIRKVKDIYATNPRNEPGWYAIRELLERIRMVS